MDIYLNSIGKLLRERFKDDKISFEDVIEFFTSIIVCPPDSVNFNDSKEDEMYKYQTVVREEKKIVMECKGYKTTIIKEKDYKYKFLLRLKLYGRSISGTIYLDEEGRFDVVALA